MVIKLLIDIHGYYTSAIEEMSPSVQHRYRMLVAACKDKRMPQ